MLVKFKHPWFAPTEVIVRDKVVSISGHKYDKGVQEVPEALKDRLPSSAEIVDKKLEEEKEEVSNDIKDYDQVRAASDELEKVAEEAEKELKEVRSANLAKAREAKAKKNKEG